MEGIKYFVRGIARSIIRGSRVSWFDSNFKIRQIPFINKFFVRDADIVIANHWPVAHPVYKSPSSKGEKHYFIRDVEQWATYYENEVEAFKLNMKRLVVAEWIKDYLQENLNLDVEQVITNGFNFKNFAIYKKRYNYDDCVISMIYSSHPMKAAHDGIKVLREVKKKHPKKILFFGFEAMPKNLNFEFEYIRRAQGDKVLQIYEMTDIFFCPSIQEGFHNPPSEAMAAKCAVVATSVGSVPKTINNMTNGISVEPRDTSSMIKYIDLLIKNRDLRISLAEAGHESIKNLTWDESINKLDNIFSS